MDEGKLILAATVGAVALAGATLWVVLGGVPGGFAGGGGATAAAAAGDDPATATATPTPPRPSEYVSDLASGDVVDARRLADAHAASLEGRTYEATVTVVRRDESGAKVGERTRTVRVGTDAVLVRSVEGDERTTERVAWTGGSVAAERTTAGGETTYDRPAPAAVRHNATVGETVARYLRSGDFSVVGTGTENGQTVVRLRADEPSVEAAAALGVREVSVLEGRATVTPDGRVRELVLQFTHVTEDGSEVGVTATVEFGGVGSTTVERPEWVETASARSESDTDDGPDAPAEPGSLSRPGAVAPSAPVVAAPGRPR